MDLWFLGGVSAGGGGFGGGVVSAVLNYDQALDRPILTKIDEDQRQATIAKCQSLLDTMSDWQRVPSGNLPPPVQLGQNEDFFRPWDASLRVAYSTQGAVLWSDDLALRKMAEAQGIPTFGTWALCQALYSTPEGNWLPPPIETKKRLLRARIADVPITATELDEVLDDSAVPDIAAGLFLLRPRTWTESHVETFAWYLKRVKTMTESPHRRQVPDLLYAACSGWGTATPPEVRTLVIGGVLATTLLTVRDPEMTPALLAVSRYAAYQLDPQTRPDPLPHAARHILQSLEAVGDNTPPAQTLDDLFSQTDPTDQQTIRAIVSEDG